MPEYDLFLLIHPERWPTNESGVIAGPDLSAECALTDRDMPDFDHAYGARVSEVMTLATRAVVVLDELAFEDVTQGDLDEFDLTWDPNDVDCRRLISALRATSQRGPELVCGGPRLADFEYVVQAGSLDVGRRVGNRIGCNEPVGRILVGGFNRYDCIRRSVAALERRGWEVTVCPTTALPLEAEGIGHYLRIPLAG